MSTLLTAPVAVFSGLAAWFTYQGAKRNTSVLTEGSLKWINANLLEANILVTNLDVEKITIASVEVKKPRGILVRKAVQGISPSFEVEYSPSEKPAKIVHDDLEVYSPGHEKHLPGLIIGSNRQYFKFYVNSSGLCSGQMLKFRLRYSTSSLSICNKALLARAIIPAAPSKSADDKVSSNA